MPPCPMTNLRKEVECLYAPELAAPKTWYVIRQVMDEVQALGVTSTDQLTAVLVSQWLKEYSGKRSSMTNKKLLTGLRAVVNYCVYQDYISRSPFEFRGLKQWIKARKTTKHRHHSAESILAVLNLLETEAAQGWKNHRLLALVSVYCFTGMRKLEALRLKVEDFDLENGLVSIVARKRLKTVESEAVIPVPNALIPTLKKWLPETGSEWAFPGVRKTGPWTEGPHGQKALDYVKEAGVRAGVQNFTILSLRHSFATHAESLWGLSPEVVRRILRHTNLRTQEEYRHADLANLKRQVKDISFNTTPKDRGREEGDRGTEAALGA